MVENRPWMTAFYYVVLTLGVLVVAFPLYITFIASTLTMEQVLQAPMPLLPGDQFINNYARVLTAGSTHASAAPVGQMMLNSFVMAMVIAVGKIAISIISAFAIIYFRFPLKNFFFWMIFITLMLPVEVRILHKCAASSTGSVGWI